MKAANGPGAPGTRQAPGQESDVRLDGTRLGVATAGFPNMFMVLGANSCFANLPPVIEAQVEFISDMISRAQRTGAVVEATQEAESYWTGTCKQIADTTLFSKTESWIFGANIPGAARHSDQPLLSTSGSFVPDLKSGRTARLISLLNDRGQRLLRRPARLEKAREVAPATQLRNAQFDVPARVSQSRSRYPLLWLRRLSVCSPCPAAHRPSISSSIRRFTAKPIISRRNVASEPFSSSSRRAILSSVIEMGPKSELRVATHPYRGTPR